MPIFIYGLKCPIAGAIRYIGKSADPQERVHGHLCDSRRNDHHTARWLRKLLSMGLQPEVVILHEVQPGERWQDAERTFIASAKSRGWMLTNSTPGGEGFDDSDPVKVAMANAKRIASLKARWNTPELKEVARQSGLRAWADPIKSARRRAAIGSDKVKAKQSKAAKEKWEDPVKGTAARLANSTIEKRIKLSAAAVRRATPEYRKMMAEKTRLSWIGRRESL